MTVSAEFTDKEYAYAWELFAEAPGIETWRRTLALVLWSWGAADSVVETARVGLSELLANVVRHVPDPRCRLSAVRDGARVMVRVHDRSPCMPVVSRPAWDAEAGRGLWMLRAMCQDFGCDPEGDGKCVWFALDLRPDGAVAGCEG